MNSSTQRKPPELKICGITRAEDLAVCHDEGVDFIGFNFYSESKRFIEPTTAIEIWRSFAAVRPSSPVKLVLVTVDAPMIELQMLRSLFPDAYALQLHGKETPAFAKECAGKLSVKIWKALPATENTRVQFESYSKIADKILLDSPVVPEGAGVPGGSGAAFDWKAFSDVIGRTGFGVAGGIHPGNIAELLQYRPRMIDVASGAEAVVGIKSKEKISELVAACRKGV